MISVHRKFVFVLFCFILSAVLSIPIFDSKIINPDFFVFYYVGDGIVHGMRPYADFADNKGIVLYDFFALLSLLFGRNYISALYFCLSVVDAFTVIFLVFFLRNILKGAMRHCFVIAVLAMTYIKASNIGLYNQGFFSESIGLLFITISLFLAEKNRVVSSTFFFMIAVFTRMTYGAYVVILFLLLKNKYGNIVIIRLCKWILIFGGALCALSWIQNGMSFNYITDNLVMYNLNYSELNSASKLYQILDITGRVWWNTYWVSIVFIAYTYIRLHKFKIHNLSILTAFVLLIPLFVYSSPRIHPQNLLQWAPPVIYTLYTLLLSREVTKDLKILVGCSLLLSVWLSYIFYFLLGSIKIVPYRAVSESAATVMQTLHNDKNNLLVITNYPQIYLETGKMSPDRYFQHFFISKYYNNPSSDITVHKKLSKDVVRNTYFIAPLLSGYAYDEAILAEYLNNFGNSFKLQKVGEYPIYEGKLYVYESVL